MGIVGLIADVGWVCLNHDLTIVSAVDECEQMHGGYGVMGEMMNDVGSIYTYIS